MSAKALLDAIWTRLSASTVYSTVGGRIGLDSVAADSALPVVVYTVESTTLTDAFDGIVRYDLTIAFTIYQSGSGGVAIHTISDQIKSAFATSMYPTGFDRLTLVRSSVGAPSFEDDCWTMTDRYRAIGYLLP